MRFTLGPARSESYNRTYRGTGEVEKKRKKNVKIIIDLVLEFELQTPLTFISSILFIDYRQICNLFYYF